MKDTFQKGTLRMIHLVDTIKSVVVQQRAKHSLYFTLFYTYLDLNIQQVAPTLLSSDTV